MNYCYYATHSHHVRLEYDYSDSSGSDSESASASSSSTSTTSTAPSSSSSNAAAVPRRMDIVDLDMIKLINTGGSGKVYLVRDKIEHQHLALKVIPKTRNVFNCNKAKVTEEKNIHSFLTMESDDFFLPLVASWSDGDNFYLASEYVPGGDLALRIMQQRTFEEAEAKYYIAELIVALERLHARKIIHRDIKPSNILIRPDGHLVLADFGVSKRFSSYETDESYANSSECSSSNSSSDCYSSAVEACCRLGIGIPSSSFYIGSRDDGPAEEECLYMTSDDCGTPYFMSPEQHRGDKYSFEVDYWAVGVILYRMLTGKMPFGDCALNKGQIARSVLEDDVSFDGQHSTTVSMVAQDFILRLLAKDPSYRIHPSKIRKHPFFYGIDWSSVETRKLNAPWLPYVPPIPKHSRPIKLARPKSREVCPNPYFAGTHRLHPLLNSDDMTQHEIASFTWYSPYARLRHLRSQQTLAIPIPTQRQQPPSPRRLYQQMKKPKKHIQKVASINSDSDSDSPSSSSMLSFNDSPRWRWKSWFRSVFCSSGSGGIVGGGSAGERRQLVGRRRRLHGWYQAV
ncbi:hypothetical protein GYMLUDRAFT_241851 [Collybiopsis luxurians FD-317 M1]|uniref:non-specific serine/threonine protein kinase n=1 Tax=Collybiopsis luxurians FD-317 M1 TaxID=944289 RepID=A0A0D0BH82_9AGAR|nr:hypothetical protein GYMLUDRAFT_241851 [Collybiopsis luxurians FD-317 M1]